MNTFKAGSFRTPVVFSPSHIILHLALTIPLIAACTWVLLPAFGIHPALGYFQPGFTLFIALFEQPGVLESLLISFSTALLATCGAVLLALLVLIPVPPQRFISMCRPWLACMLALPYLTAVLGLQFLISPSGWFARLLAQLFAWQSPPAISTVPDAWNIGYVFLLMLKETGFLIMLIIAQIDSLPFDKYNRLGKSFGYSQAQIWLKIILPLLYPKIRLGLWVLFVFAATNVEVALFASPNAIPTFSIRIWQWFTDSDSSAQLLACAGASVFFLLIAFCLLMFWLFEKIIGILLGSWLVNGRRGWYIPELCSVVQWRFLLALHIIPFLCMLIWSLADQWRFPALTPEFWSFDLWMRTDLADSLINSLLVGSAVATLSVVLVIVFSELSSGIRSWHDWLFYAPLIIPQIGLVFGMTVLVILFSINGTMFGIVAAQMIFVLPYCFILLAYAWSLFDKRYSTVATSMGYSQLAVILRVKLPMLLSPVLFTWTLALTISFSLFLPSFYAGEGKVPLLITDLVSLGSSYDRRLIGVISTWLTLIPLLAFAISAATPRYLYGKYRLSN